MYLLLWDTSSSYSKQTYHCSMGAELGGECDEKKRELELLLQIGAIIIKWNQLLTVSFEQESCFTVILAPSFINTLLVKSYLANVNS